MSGWRLSIWQRATVHSRRMLRRQQDLEGGRLAARRRTNHVVVPLPRPGPCIVFAEASRAAINADVRGLSINIPVGIGG